MISKSYSAREYHRLGPRKHFWFLAAVTVLPPFLWLTWMAANCSDWTNPEALDYAQMARHLLQGEGFVTSAIPPLSLAFVSRLEHHPSLYHPPLFPLWESLVFRSGQIGPRWAALASGLPWILTAWLVFILAHRLFDLRTALLAVALFAVNLELLGFSISGRPHLLTALLVTGLLWILARFRTRKRVFESETVEDDAASIQVPWGGVIASGVIVGLAVLSDYSLIWPLIGSTTLFWFLWLRWARLGYAGMGSFRTTENLPFLLPGVFLAGVLVTTFPWLTRNYYEVDRPYFSLNRYDLLTETDTYPGKSVFRHFTAVPPSPLNFLIQHPGEVVKKGLAGLDNWGLGLISLANWVVLGLFVGGCLLPPEGKAGRIQRTFLGMLLAQGILLCFTSQRFDLLAAFVPGMTVWAAAAVFRLWDRFTSDQDEEWEWAVPDEEPPVNAWNWHRILAVGTLWLLAALPLISTRGKVSSPPLRTSPNVAYLAKKIPPGGGVLTDSPWLMACYGSRPAVWLPQEERDLEGLIKRFGPRFSWVYFSPYRNLLGAEEWADWWYKALNSPLGFKNFLPFPSQRGGEMLLKRYSEKEEKPRYSQGLKGAP